MRRYSFGTALAKKFFGWVSYAYTHAERRETPDAAYTPFLFDNTHIVSIVANYSPTTKTEIGAKWQYASGTSAVPLSTLLMIQDPVTLGMHPVLSDVAGSIVPTEFPAYHRLDLRFTRKREWWGLPVTMFTEIWNIYNSKKQDKVQFRQQIRGGNQRRQRLRMRKISPWTWIRPLNIRVLCDSLLVSMLESYMNFNASAPLT